MIESSAGVQATPPLTKELWTSFASLLRSHVAMHSIARANEQLRIASATKSTLEVLGPNGRLILLAPTASGIGTMEFRPEAGELGDEYAGFFFTESGLLHVEGPEEAMDVEAAVEYFLYKVQG